MKLMMQFEYQKNESDTGAGGTDHRDYRLTNNSEVLAAFQSDLGTASTLYTW